MSRLLHTPLMSLTNAISAIAVVGSILLAGEKHDTLTTVLGTVAVAASMTNIVSGFLITDRMLKMFKKREEPQAVSRRTSIQARAISRATGSSSSRSSGSRTRRRRAAASSPASSA